MAEKQNAPRLTNQDALQTTHRTRTKATRSLPFCPCPRVDGGPERQCVGTPPEGQACRAVARAALIRRNRDELIALDTSQCGPGCAACGSARSCASEKMGALRADIREMLEAGGDRG